MSIVTTALPSSYSTLEMSPTRTPATRTVWPWPGVTAWAVSISAFSWKGFSSRSGTRRRSFWTMIQVATRPTSDQPEDREEVAQVVSDRLAHQSSPLERRGTP